MKSQSYSQASKQIISLLTCDIMPPRSRSALQEDPQSPFTEILVRAPEKPEIRLPSPLCPDLSEIRGSAECHQRVHMESQRLSSAVGGASYFRHCLPGTLRATSGPAQSEWSVSMQEDLGAVDHLPQGFRIKHLEGKETDRMSRCLQDGGVWETAARGNK
ncbi:uncharacterized protein FYN12_006835 isoform 1-T2 [Phoenicopterus ruber ruber]